MNKDFDIAVIGSGFSGSLLAMIARRLGRSVILIERGRHPRFAIGESSTPLANLLLEELARRYDLPGIAPLAKWGTWQNRHPEIGCGLKRGFTFYHHVAGHPWIDHPARANQLLVAASPHDGIADTHWYRPDFDHFLVRQARESGVEYVDETRVDGIRFSDAGCELSTERQRKPSGVRVGFVFDATGPRGCLHRLLNLHERPLAAMPSTQGLYSHFRDVRRWDELQASREPPPYPVDDAAVHHVFDGGWIWVLRFNNGVTSAGVAATDAFAEKLHFTDGEPAWRRLLERLPAVQEQFAGAKPCLPFVHAPRLSFRSAAAAGERWALLPSAAGFVDPLLSTGFPLTLLGIERLATILAGHADARPMTTQLRDYERETFCELDVTAELIGALYANMHDCEMFNALALLYFAAAMHAETTRRLGGSARETSFLRRDHPQFAPALRACVNAAQDRLSAPDRKNLRARILEVIDPINLARLGDPARHNWYPCRAEDLLATAPKLGVERAEIDAMLRRCGFGDEPTAHSATRTVRKSDPLAAPANVR